MGAGPLKKGGWDLPYHHCCSKDLKGARIFPTSRTAYPSEKGEPSSVLISSGLEGGSKNQACGARLCVGAPPTAFVRCARIQQSLLQLLIEDHVPYKGGLLVTSSDSGTAGNLFVVQKKLAIFGIPFLCRSAPDPFPILLQLPFRAQLISFLGVMTQDSPL